MNCIRIVSRRPGRVNNSEVHTLVSVITVYMCMRKRNHALQQCEQQQQ